MTANDFSLNSNFKINMNINQLLSHFLLEMIGVIIWVFGVQTFRADIGDQGMSGVAIVFPFIAIAAHASCYRVTGGALNPILTLANAFRKDKKEGFDMATAFVMIFAQFVGFSIGIPLVWWFAKGTGPTIAPVQRTSNGDYQISEAVAWEFFGSALLTLIYLTLTGAKTTPTKDAGAQAIGLGFASSTLLALAWPISRGSLNPFYALMQNVFRAVDNEDEEVLEYVYIYIIFPLFGLALGYVLHQFVLLPGTEKASRDIEQEGKTVENQA